MTTDAPRWRQYRVAQRHLESANVLSLELVAADDRPLQPFRAGQFLTFKLRNAEGRPLPRNYSISSDPVDPSHYRISVKREIEGVGSGFMHDVALENVIVEGSAPKGDFVLDEASQRPVLLLAGGIGITPLLAMAHALSRMTRPVRLIHACENGRVQPFRAEIGALCATAPQIEAITFLNCPEAQDIAEDAHHHVGQVTRDALRAILPAGEVEAYLCGPAGFMQAMYENLLALGLHDELIRYEFFGPATVFKASAPRAPVASLPLAAPDLPDGQPLVHFSQSGLSAVWDGSQRTLLDFAEAQGLTPAFSCRNGICNTCLCAVDGEVSYVDEPLEMPEDGHALLCCSVPKGSVSLRL